MVTLQLIFILPFPNFFSRAKKIKLNWVLDTLMYVLFWKRTCLICWLFWRCIMYVSVINSRMGVKLW